MQPIVKLWVNEGFLPLDLHPCPKWAQELLPVSRHQREDRFYGLSTMQGRLLGRYSLLLWDGKFIPESCRTVDIISHANQFSKHSMHHFLLEIPLRDVGLWETRPLVRTQRVDSETRGVQWTGDWSGQVSCLVSRHTQSVTLSSAQVLSPVPHWLSNVGYTFFPGHCLDFLLGDLKICLPWDWSNFRRGL